MILCILSRNSFSVVLSLHRLVEVPTVISVAATDFTGSNAPRAIAAVTDVTAAGHHFDGKATC